jgi:hypothetical protein
MADFDPTNLGRRLIQSPEQAQAPASAVTATLDDQIRYHQARGEADAVARLQAQRAAWISQMQRPGGRGY